MVSASSAAGVSAWLGSKSFRRRASASATLRSSAPPASSRVDYVDTLRGVAIVAVVLVHVAQVFNPWDECHIANAERSRLVRRLRGQFAGSFLEFYPHFFEGIYPRGNLSRHHLWFLAHLFAYSVVALPLFRYLSGPRGGRVLRFLARWCTAPGGILWLAVPLVLERNLLWGLFPERHMLATDWSNHALLLVAYVYGFLLANSPWLGAAIDAQWHRAGVVAATGTALLMAGTWSGLVPGRIPPPYSLRYLAFWTLYAICAWAWMVALLGAGRRWLDCSGSMIAPLRRIGYALYVIHQPVIVAVAYFVVQWRAPVFVKFVVTLATSAIATIGLAELFARLTGLRRPFGLDPRRRLPAERAA